MRQFRKLGCSAQSRKTGEAKGGSRLSNFIKAGWLAVITLLLIAAVFFLCYALHVAPEGWMSLVAFLPLLRETIAATESNYSKDEPHEKTLSPLPAAGVPEHRAGVGRYTADPEHPQP
jgi:hypothetical protein